MDKHKLYTFTIFTRKRLLDGRLFGSVRQMRNHYHTPKKSPSSLLLCLNSLFFHYSHSPPSLLLSSHSFSMMRTPVLLLLDSLLSQDASGIQSTLQTMRNELPPSVTAAYLPYRFGQHAVDPAVIVQHLSVYLQTFPCQAATASANDGSLPLHFAASYGDAVVAHVVWQAVSEGPNDW